MLDLLDVHTHTVASIHAYSTIREMAEAAKARGLALLGISDHAPGMPGACHKSYFSNFKVIPRTYAGIELYMGAELNIMDYTGSTDLQEKILERIDYAIASLHEICIPPGSVDENTGALIRAMDNPKVKILGHPDNPEFPVDFDRLARAAKEKHVLLELNNSSQKPKNRRGTKESAAALLSACKKSGTKIILGSDAHIDVEAGRHDYAMERLLENDFPEELVINQSPEDFRGWIGK